MYAERTMISAEALERAAAARSTATSAVPEPSSPRDDDPAPRPVARRHGAGPRHALRRGTTVLVGVGAVVATILLPAGTASADPSASTWQRLRMCESSNRYDTNTGNGYYGAYQFDLSTWRSVGGSGYPSQASAAEQDARALMLYRMRGWQPWECARILGLVNDSDAKSKKTSDIVIGAPAPAPAPAPAASGTPAWPGTQYFPGDTSAYLKQWQLQMKARGAPLTGTGYFGGNTLAVVHDLQQASGLVVSDVIGPKTWAAAWTGAYTIGAAAPAAAPAPAPAAAPAPAPAPAASAGVPAAPANKLSQGAYSESLKQWQLQMKARGAPLTGTGYFGPNTLAVVTKLQQQNGLATVGYIGTKTWYAAWYGSYTP